MPRDGAIIFGDITDKLAVLNLACDKCGRAGCYRITRLIDDRGRDDIATKLLDLNRNGVTLGAAAREFVERVTGQPATVAV
jgi:hypothetical protein